MSALARVIAVLHARQADVGSLRYVVRRDEAVMTIDVTSGDGSRLGAQLRRLVDVTQVQVRTADPMAVAS
jgi:acetolactate synthase small subunit